MSKTQKIWICCLKQTELSEKKAIKQDLFIRIPMQEECDLNAQFLRIILKE